MVETQKVRGEMLLRRRGPWTEEEDMQLVCTVSMLGDRRWDFIAQVSGLNRSGKSCRLRWVNYLHPGLKRGRMSPQEESLVIKFHARWGNRWSRIARFMPGRTDNEIKNYWRTHMRKKAQERDIGLLSPTAASPTTTYQSPCLLLADTSPDNGIDSAHTTHNNNACSCLTRTLIRSTHQTVIDGLPMDQILLKEVNTRLPALLGIQEPNDEACNNNTPYSPPTTEIWCHAPEMFWNMGDQEINQDADSTIWLW